MEKMKVRDLMVSTDKFPKISETATLFEALSALEKAQKAFLSGESQQRILLVENEKNRSLEKFLPLIYSKDWKKNTTR